MSFQQKVELAKVLVPLLAGLVVVLVLYATALRVHAGRLRRQAELLQVERDGLRRTLTAIERMDDTRSQTLAAIREVARRSLR